MDTQATQEPQVITKPIPDTISTVPMDATVSIVVPLYGLTAGEPVVGLNAQALEMCLSRLVSKRNKVYTFFVGEGEALAEGVVEVVTGLIVAKSGVAVNVPISSTLGAYINAGIKEAVNTTNSNFIIVATPTQMLGLSTVDDLIEGLNKGNIGVLSAFDLKNKFPALGYNEPIAPAQFDKYQFNPPRQYNGVNIHLFAMPRAVAEMAAFDEKYRVTELLQQDMFYGVRGKDTISVHQAIPTYSLDLDWKALETSQVLGEDVDYFKSKWGFLPQV